MPSTLRPPMVSRPSALHCLVALALAAPRVASAEPSEGAAEVETTQVPEDGEAPERSESEPESEPERSEPEPESEPEPATDDDTDLDDEEVSPAQTPRVPDRLPRLQRIGWYHVLGAFTLGTTAGLLAGLAERQEDRATRIASGYDLETGASTLYRDRQQEYEQILDRGQAFETSAIVVGALAGATAIAAITLFALDARRNSPSATARRTRIGPGAMEVRF